MVKEIGCRKTKIKFPFANYVYRQFLNGCGIRTTYSLLKDHFKWQDDYSAVSVGEGQFNSIKKYILHQEDHHRYQTFSQEIEKLMKQ